MKKGYTHTKYFFPTPDSPGSHFRILQQQPLLQFLVDSFRASVHLQKYTYSCMSPSDLQAGVLPIPLYGHCSFYCSRPAVTKQMTHLSC